MQFDRVNDSLGTPTATADDYTSSYQPTQHLLEAGCCTIAHLCLAKYLSISSKRLQGYQAALNDHHIVYDPSLVLNGTNFE